MSIAESNLAMEFTKEQIEEDRKSRTDLDTLETRFRRKFQMKWGV
jgi:hypothetical protein